MTLRPTAAILALAVFLLPAAGAFAQAPVVDARELDERLKRLERLFGSESLFKLFDEVESLGTEVRELRGQLEALSHRIDQLEERQRTLYLDADQRLQRIESAAQAQVADPSLQPVTPPVATGTPAPTATPSQPAPTTLTTETPTTTPGIDPFAEQQAYQSAFDLVRTGRYEEAAIALGEFIVEYPTGSYAGNAQYWLGETYYVRRQFEQAVREYERLVSAYPNSRKLPDALLKIGYSQDELGNKAEAERALGQLIQRHPQSTAATLARKRLLIIRQ